MLIFGMIKVVKLYCCCAKTHASLYGISAFEILPYLCEIVKLLTIIAQTML